MPDSEISDSVRKEMVGNIVTALEIVPESAIVSIRDALERHEEMDPIKIQKLTGLSGQHLDGALLLFNGTRIRPDMLLVALDTALAIAQNARKTSERIDLSWTGPIQFSVEGRTTPSVLVEMIQDARTSIIVTGYSITQEADRVVQLLEDAVDRNVEVILVVHSDDEHRNFDTLSRLWTRKKKPQVYSRRPGPLDGYFKIHAKMIVVDGLDLLVTSANLTRHGMTNNFEIGLRIRGRTARKAEALIRNMIAGNYLELAAI